MKKMFLILMTALVLLSTSFTAMASKIEYFYDGEWHEYVGNTMKLKVNGEEIKGEMPPIIFSDRSVVPAREVFEALGAEVSWNADNQLVSVSYEETTVKLIINSKIAKINSKDVTMEIPAKLINGKTMIPARFVGENIGMEVDFDSKTDTVIINNKEETIENEKDNDEETDSGLNSEDKEDDKNSSSDLKDENVGSGGETELKNITYKKYEIDEKNKLLTIFLKAEEEVKFSHFVLKEPERIVIDVLDSSFVEIPKDITIERGNIDKIRFGKQTNSARIVIDVSEDIGYTAKYDNEEVVITIKMTSTEERKVDMLASAVYRKQGTIDCFESPFKILSAKLDKEKNLLLIYVDTDGKKGEEASKKVNSLYAKAIGYSESVETDDETEKTEKTEKSDETNEKDPVSDSDAKVRGLYTVSLKNSKIKFNVSGEKMLIVKPEIEPLKKSVMLDAGHGGNDPGAIHTDEDGNVLLKEKDLNLSVTLKVKELLEKEGVLVNLTRDEDIYVDFLKVGSIANSIGSTLFVSIHTNSFTNPAVNGIEVYGYLDGGTVSNGMSSEQLSKNILDAMITETEAYDRGVRDGKNLAVVNSTKAPAALVEIGFITNDI